MADEQTAPEAPQTETTDGSAETQTPDPIMARLDELKSQIGSLASTPPAERPLTQQINEPEPQPDDYATDGVQEGYEGYDQYGQPAEYDDQQAVQQLQQFIQQQVQEGVQSQVTPWVHQQKAMQLEQKYPELAKDAGPTLQAAQQRAEAINRPELARDPDFIELVYLAQRASQQAQQETPAGASSEVTLEGGGAAPDQPEDDLATRIVNAGSGPTMWK